MNWYERLQQQYQVEQHARTMRNAIEIADPEVYTTTRVQDGGALPGRPTWGPWLNSDGAQLHERDQARIDPIGGLEWDRRADARTQAWEDSPFAEAQRRLLA